MQGEEGTNDNSKDDNYDTDGGGGGERNSSVEGKKRDDYRCWGGGCGMSSSVTCDEEDEIDLGGVLSLTGGKKLSKEGIVLKCFAPVGTPIGE